MLVDQLDVPNIEAVIAFGMLALALLANEAVIEYEAVDGTKVMLVAAEEVTAYEADVTEPSRILAVCE